MGTICGIHYPPTLYIILSTHSNSSCAFPDEEACLVLQGRSRSKEDGDGFSPEARGETLGGTQAVAGIFISF